MADMEDSQEGNQCRSSVRESGVGSFSPQFKLHADEPQLLPLVYDGSSAAMFRVDSASSSSSGATFSTIASSSLSSCVVSTGSGVPVISLGHLASVADMHEACEKLEQLHLSDKLYSEIEYDGTAGAGLLKTIVPLGRDLVAVDSLDQQSVVTSISDQESSESHKTLAIPSSSLETIPEIVGVAILPETPASIERRKLLPTLSETLGMVGIVPETDISALQPVALPIHLQRRRRSVDETVTASSPYSVGNNSLGASRMLSAFHGVGEVIPSSRLYEGGRMLDYGRTLNAGPGLSPSLSLPDNTKQVLRSNLKLSGQTLMIGQKSGRPGQVRVRFAE